MSSEITLEDRGQALENEYFRRREQELIEKLRAKLNAGDGGANAAALQCPKCDGRLVETDFENVKIDVCNKCHGVWLDSGELARVARRDEENKDEGNWIGRWLA